VAVRGHLPLGLGPQRRDRHRPAIIGVGLVRIAGPGQPHPRGQPGLDVQHLLARGGQLLGQQAAQPGGASTAQVRSGHTAAHASSCRAWSGQARTHCLPSGSSAGPIATAVCDPLCGSTPISTPISTLQDHHEIPGQPRLACLIPDLRWTLVPLPGHATARSDRAGTSI
jgi:hypothetical protein